jgi:galactose mutarotase-like enzyme
VYTIEQQNLQYKTYILTDDTAGSQIQVVPERGGIITHWRIKEREIFYLDTERFTHPDLSVRGGNPILFPICGNLPDNAYTVDGKQYTLKQHGFARELPWQVTAQNTDGKASITVTLESNQKTKEVYPFDFQLAFTYELQGDTLAVKQEYHNLSSTPMPFSAGFHPYFLCGEKTQLEVEIPAQNYQDNKTKQIHPFNGSFDFDQDEIDFAFGQLTSKSTSVVDRSRSMKLVIDYDDFSTWLVFWTVKGKDFYCLEPWSATRNSLNTGENLTVLAPGSSCNAIMRLTAKFS